MKIGIDGSRAFLKQRTGIEEYSYQTIKHLADYLKKEKVILYLRRDQKVDFDLPKNWEARNLDFYYFWTQLGLSLEMFRRPVDALFVPAHTVPFIHPKKTIVVIHGLEYEFVPRAYSWQARQYMRFFIKKSCKWAQTIVSVSENTKKDLLGLYGVPAEKIKVVYEGYNQNFEFRISNFEKVAGLENSKLEIDSKFIRRGGQNSKFLLFIGRLEERKNIIGIIKAFEILKERYGIPHKLVLAGKFGYGAENIRAELARTNCIKDIILPGFVSEEEKWELLKKADVFLFPTFYEGFGIPILEAQSAGTPVICSNNSSVPEVVDVRRDAPTGRLYRSAILIDPMNAEQIADAAYQLISDYSLRDDIIKKGYENAKRFSWDKCASRIAGLIIDKG